jgi:hypothetical protein
MVPNQPIPKSVDCPRCGAQLAQRVGRTWLVMVDHGVRMNASGGVVCRCGGEAAIPATLPPGQLPRYETRSIGGHL